MVGSWSRGGLENGHYCTGYPWTWIMRCSQASQAGKASVVWGRWLKYKYGEFWQVDFHKNLIDTWAKVHGIEWVYHLLCHAPASRKTSRYNGLLKSTLRTMGCGTFKHQDRHLAKATWLVNTTGSASRAGADPFMELLLLKDLGELGGWCGRMEESSVYPKGTWFWVRTANELNGMMLIAI